MADFDVVIIGAGISGINFAYRLQERHPNLSYCIVEARHEMGGTWSLFKYPGIRSDSDLFTFGFQWRPWQATSPIAEGASILRYLNESAEEYGIDKHIKYKHAVKNLDWSSKNQQWTLDLLVDGNLPSSLKARFVLVGTGYYDYQTPLQAEIPGIDKFKGQVIHPQFWPKDLDYTGKNMVIVGSGATAITILPNVADKAAHATILQRSPSYILSVPHRDPIDRLLRFFLPASLSLRIIRFKWIFAAFMLTTICKWFPRVARWVVLRRTARMLPQGTSLDPNFTPSYNPWEQRMCLCPDGDFYKCLRTGKASVETGVIDKVTAKSIKLKSGKELNPDIIVTATGLHLQLLGGVTLSIDGQEHNLSNSFVWKGCMFQDVPNLVMAFGYVDASWTLGADATALMAMRLMSDMQDGGYRSIIPRLSDEEQKTIKEQPFMTLKSTYVKKAQHRFPKVGDLKQFRPRSYYWKDAANAAWGDVKTNMEWRV